MALIVCLSLSQPISADHREANMNPMDAVSGLWGEKGHWCVLSISGILIVYTVISHHRWLTWSFTMLLYCVLVETILCFDEWSGTVLQSLSFCCWITIRGLFIFCITILKQIHARYFKVWLTVLSAKYVLFTLYRAGIALVQLEMVLVQNYLSCTM